jgi:hypothetical protein
MAYDVFFLSYNEPNADDNWAHLQTLSPTARRLDGIKGLRAAHQECAKQSRTSHFFVVDADSQITDPNVLSYKISPYELSYVHLWYAHNPVNGLEYGWGGLKLFPRNVFSAEANTQSIDMTTSFDLKIMPQVVSRTMFNTTPYDTWRSAFRESVKLSSGIIRNKNIQENQERLESWKTAYVTAPNAKWAIRGAYDGEAFGQNTDLTLINDWSWLQGEFTRRYPDVS